MKQTFFSRAGAEEFHFGHRRKSTWVTVGQPGRAAPPRRGHAPQRGHDRRGRRGVLHQIQRRSNQWRWDAEIHRNRHVKVLS